MSYYYTKYFFPPNLGPSRNNPNDTSKLFYFIKAFILKGNVKKYSNILK